MSKLVRDRDRGGRQARDNPRDNPDLLGVDLADAARIAFGMMAGAQLTDQLVAPVVGNVWAGRPDANDTMGQILDAALTAGGGWLASYLWGFVDPRGARDVLVGGVAYGMGKAITAFLPNASLSARFPYLPSFGFLQPRVLPAGNGTLALTAPTTSGLMNSLDVGM